MDPGGDSNHHGNGNGSSKPDHLVNSSDPSTDASPKGLPVESSKPVEASAGIPLEPLIVVEKPKPVPLKPRQRAFLAAIEEGLTKTGACKAAKISRQTFYDWLDREDALGDAFRAAFAECFEAGTDSLIDEAKRRAKDGWDEPVFNHKTGEEIGVIRRYDSKLLLALLGQRDASFRVRHEVTGAGGAPLHPSKVEHVVKYDFSDLNPDEVNDLYRKLSRSRVLPPAGN